MGVEVPQGTGVEVGGLDLAAAQRQLMEAITQLQDHFDNVFLFGCWPFAEVEGWTIIDVEQITGARAAAAA